MLSLMAFLLAMRNAMLSTISSTFGLGPMQTGEQNVKEILFSIQGRKLILFYNELYDLGPAKGTEF
jgi:hypothetical protein